MFIVPGFVLILLNLDHYHRPTKPMSLEHKTGLFMSLYHRIIYQLNRWRNQKYEWTRVRLHPPTKKLLLYKRPFVPRKSK